MFTFVTIVFVSPIVLFIAHIAKCCTVIFCKVFPIGIIAQYSCFSYTRKKLYHTNKTESIFEVFASLILSFFVMPFEILFFYPYILASLRFVKEHQRHGKDCSFSWFSYIISCQLCDAVQLVLQSVFMNKQHF